ncbi:unnamed protein product [Effrenium voratum]|uniref:Uncharacterized protein n=1 Tax=Effrenium voratum TaxID=2562239 RepID=A0AA36HTM5_9DINO|nr:unnamed protein product [Effrenium voratum]
MCGTFTCPAALSSCYDGPCPINEDKLHLTKQYRGIENRVMQAISWQVGSRPSFFFPACPTSWEAPINITNANRTAAKAIGDLMGKNLLHDADEVNAMKGPKTTRMPRADLVVWPRIWSS